MNQKVSKPADAEANAPGPSCSVPDSVATTNEPPKFVQDPKQADEGTAKLDTEMPSTTPTPAAREPTNAFEVPSTEKNDPILKQQSYRFQQLPKWEQQSLIRMHKNLGHPSNDRLVQAAQENSVPSVCRKCSSEACQTSYLENYVGL